MYTLVTAILFIVGLAGMLIGYVDREPVYLAVSYLFSLAAFVGLFECLYGERDERY